MNPVYLHSSGSILQIAEDELSGVMQSNDYDLGRVTLRSHNIDFITRTWEKLV